MSGKNDRAALLFAEGFFVNMYAVADAEEESDEEVGGVIEDGKRFADFLRVFLLFHKDSLSAGGGMIILLRKNDNRLRRMIICLRQNKGKFPRFARKFSF